MFKRGMLFILIIAVVFSAVSCKDSDPVYSYCELIIPLGEDFKEVSNKDFDITYSNGEYVVAILRISYVAAVKEGIPETMTTVEFAEFWLEKCGRSANVITSPLAYAEYYDDSSGTENFYLEAFYRSKYAYFVVLFATKSEAEDEGRADFLNYAQGVYFTN